MAKKSKKQGSSTAHNDEIIDERFTAATNRPQFHKPKRGIIGNSNSATTTTSVKNATILNDNGGTLIVGNSNINNNNDIASAIDSSGLGVSLTQAIASDDRFKAALNSDKFGCVPSRDKYGRKTKKKKKKEEVEEDDDEEEEEEVEEEMNDDSVKVSSKKSKKKDEKEEEMEQDNSMESRIAYLNALSRGDISASSSDDDDDDSSSDDDDGDDDHDDSSVEDNVYGKSGIFDPNHAPLPGSIPDNNSDDDDAEQQQLTEEPSPYLCILNLNWEHTRAVDVYAMLHSFCPPGTLEKVEVYPSDFGRERMEREGVEGPTGLWKRKKEAGDEDDESDTHRSSDGGNNDNDSDGINSNSGDQDSDDSNSDSEGEEDVFNLQEATSKLYSHFPPQSTVMKNSQLQTPDEEQEGFDIEKLREYEVSKLRYYFCIATFRSAQAAEGAYEHVDGMEMEASSAEIDVRVLPEGEYARTVEGRAMRDECGTLPAKYVPPEDNVTLALRQSRVSCSWERGDADRERKLTRYGMGKDAWEALAEGDDIKFYLATSDNSSSGGSSDEEEEEVVVDKKKDHKKKKGSGMRAALGLVGSDDSEDGQSVSEDSDSDASQEKNDDAKKKKQSKSSSPSESESSSDDEEEEEAMMDSTTSNKQVTYTPGKRDLEKKIRSKLQAKNAMDGRDDDGNNEQQGERQTPFEKYLEKRKEKRKERKRAARDAKESRGNDDDGGDDDNDGMYGGVDSEFGMAQFSDEDESNDKNNVGRDGNDARNDDDDGFFLGETISSSSSKKKKKNLNKQVDSSSGEKSGGRSTKEELELLIAGDDDEEHQKDYDIRGLTKLEKHKHKKLRGKRKRQLDTLATNVSGQDFKIDTSDTRFAALLNGSDGRFGIDRTNPAYKETGAMKELLVEQSKRRKGDGGGGSRRRTVEKDDDRSSGGGGGSNSSKKIKKDKNAIVGDESSSRGWVDNSSGAMQLSSLVKSLKQKVS